jgi:hypothetical protein
MLNDKYSARIVKSPTFFRETIEVGTLKSQGFEVEELRAKLLDENPLKIMPARRNKEISSAVLVRVEALTQDQLEVLKSGSLSDKKYMTMISIMKTERLIRELLNEVYVDKLNMGQKLIDDGDINVFFRRKAEEHEDIAKFQDVTIKKLKQVMKKMLKELELVRAVGKSMEILPPIPSKQFIDAIENEELSIKNVFIRG